MAESPMHSAVPADPKSPLSMTVRIRFRHQIEKFVMQMDEPFAKVLFEIAVREGVEMSRLKLTQNIEDIVETDTPRSLNLHIGEIIDCTIVNIHNLQADEVTDLVSEEDKVKIKFQGHNKDSHFEVTLLKISCLNEVLKEYSEKYSIPQEKLKFFFDGDPITGEDTPESLDMDEEAIIDVKIK